MAVAVIMPRQGQSVESCIITKWRKNVGDTVNIDDLLFSYETDKATFDELSKTSGVLLAIFYREGDEVDCLANVCIIGEPGEDISAYFAHSSQDIEARVARVPATPIPKVMYPTEPVPKITIQAAEIPEIMFPTAPAPRVTVTTTPVPRVTVPTAKVPEVMYPTAEVPEIMLPKVELPEVELPEVNVPIAVDQETTAQLTLKPTVETQGALVKTTKTPTNFIVTANTHEAPQKTPLNATQKTLLTAAQKTPTNFNVTTNTQTEAQKTPLTAAQKAPTNFSVIANTHAAPQKAPLTAAQKTPTNFSVTANTHEAAQKTPTNFNVTANTRAATQNTPLAALQKTPLTAVHKTSTNFSVTANTHEAAQKAPLNATQKTSLAPPQKTLLTAVHRTPLNIAQKAPQRRMAAGAAVDFSAGPSSGVQPGSVQTKTADWHIIPLSNARKTIAQTMRQSLANSAQLTLNTSFDATDIIGFRKRAKAVAGNSWLSAVTVTDIIVYSVSRTIIRHKSLNAHFLEDNTMKVFNDAHIGVAVDTPRGLLVPTIFRANALPLSGISSKTKELYSMCAKGAISPDLIQGASFTISNMGTLGIESFTPVLNPPQTGILGVCSIIERFRGGTPYPAIGLSLTFDHRAMDGADAARFLKALVTLLENFSLFAAIG